MNSGGGSKSGGIECKYIVLLSFSSDQPNDALQLGQHSGVCAASYDWSQNCDRPIEKKTTRQATDQPTDPDAQVQKGPKIQRSEVREESLQTAILEIFLCSLCCSTICGWHWALWRFLRNGFWPLQLRVVVEWYCGGTWVVRGGIESSSVKTTTQALSLVFALSTNDAAKSQ